MDRSNMMFRIVPLGKKILAIGVLVAILSSLVVFERSVSAAPLNSQDVMVLCYHDISKNDKVAETNVITITQQTLRTHFEYLKQNGFNPVSFQDFLDHYKTGKPLPEKSVLLTFDDGYRSMYESLLPLVKEYRYPVLIALVTDWLETGFPEPGVPLMTWAQIKEMEASGLVEFASHTHNQHQMGAINRYNDQQAKTSSLLWQGGRYETMAEHKNRIYQDLLRAQGIFQKELGHKARAIVWPYGEYTGVAVDAAIEAGFESTFSVSYSRPGPQNHVVAKRVMITGSPSTSELKKMIETGGEFGNPIKLAQLDLDSIFENNNPEQTEKNLQMAIAQVQAMGANRVALQVFVDTKATGNVEQVYFNNSQVPVKADILGHVAAQFQRAGIAPYAWAPTLAIPALFGADEKVEASDPAKKGWYDRSTPFNASVENKLSRFYEEMAMYAPSLRGVLIQDDLYLNDFEDFSKAARAAWLKEKGIELTPEFISVKENRRRWTEWKTDSLDHLSEVLIASFRRWRPEAISARNIYAEPVVQPESQEWFAQKLTNYLRLYDYTIVMSYPYMEKQGDKAGPWLTNLAKTALQNPGAAEKLVFKLQFFDWAAQKPVPSRQLIAQFKALKSAGAKHLGIYPVDPYNDSPVMLFPK